MLDPMDRSLAIKAYLERVMNMKILRLNGASAGIFGSAGVDADLLNNLKRSSMAFAMEYRKRDKDPEKLKQFSDEIYGYLQTLQLTHTISKTEANKLIDQLKEMELNI